MADRLLLSKDLALPLDAVTQTFGILAKKRRGKTYTASVMAEEMIKAKLPFAVLDPTGAWWGLRAAANGIDAGYPVVIIGGDHGDIPLEPTAGAIIADLVVEHPGYYVIDMGQMNSNAEQDRFAMEFGERLYRAKAKHRFPMHLYVDEADAFIPQQPMPDQRRMLGAYDTIVRRGGIRGIGVTLISQRPAVINKNVLYQVECLILLQILGKHDRDTIQGWVRQHGAKKQVDDLMDSLASLGLGEAWFWSPAWLDTFKRVQIRQRDTFNSSKTPEIGDAAIEPKKLAKVDIEAIRDRVAATIERAKADDPKALRARIKELEKQGTAPDQSQITEAYERGNRQGRAHGYREAIRQFSGLAHNVMNSLSGLRLTVEDLERAAQHAPPDVTAVRPPPPVAAAASTRATSRSADKDGLGNAGAVSMIRALRRNFPNAYTWAQVGTLAGLMTGNGYFNTARKVLLEAGVVTLDPLERVQANTMDEDGGYIKPREIVDLWCSKLGKPSSDMLHTIYDAPGNVIDVATLSEIIGVKPGNGYWNTGIKKLVNAGLVNKQGNKIQVSEILQ